LARTQSRRQQTACLLTIGKFRPRRDTCRRRFLEGIENSKHDQTPQQVAARKKGKWTGGHILMGYDLDSRGGKLTVNLDEAERVREIFRLYLEGTQVTETVQRFDKLGWRTKQWTTQDGKLYGGSPLRRCHIYKLLGNILYTGQVKVGDEIFPGEHEAIIDQQTFGLAPKRLKENAWTPGNAHRVKFDALLRGLIYCYCCGSGMYSTYPTNKERRYRYYVCYRSQQKLEGYCTSRSVSAPSVEEAVVESIRRGRHPSGRAGRDRSLGAAAGRGNGHRFARGVEHHERAGQESEVADRPASESGGSAVDRDPRTGIQRRSNSVKISISASLRQWRRPGQAC